MTDAYYTDDLALDANTLSQAESLLYSLKRTHKTDFICFNQVHLSLCVYMNL